jgi:23S rRNA (cytosine1962-C5)-methyltransferase
LASGHPWIFSSDVTDRGDAQPGDAVRVELDTRSGQRSGQTAAKSSGKLLGFAHYSSTSQITLRMLSTPTQPTHTTPGDRAFFLERLRAAIEHRQRIVRDSDAYRLVFSEADLLPGLIIDRYGPYLVLQTLNQGMDRSRGAIVDCLQELLAPAGILARNDASVRKLEALPLETAVLSGEIPDHISIQMNGLALTADLKRGQKTGVYLDQRENYVAAAKYAHGRVLDCFTSTGGFALHAARNPEVESVEAIDSSELALATAQQNADNNGISNINFRQADVFEYLSGLDRRFSTIVLDPPAFAKSRKSLDDAARGYKDINYRALRMLDSGGILVTCSCSHHMSEAALFEVIAEAALDAGKTLRVLERRAQSQDHPILLTVPETLYLKCLVLQVV